MKGRQGGRTLTVKWSNLIRSNSLKSDNNNKLIYQLVIVVVGTLGFLVTFVKRPRLFSIKRMHTLISTRPTEFRNRSYNDRLSIIGKGTNSFSQKGGLNHDKFDGKINFYHEVDDRGKKEKQKRFHPSRK